MIIVITQVVYLSNFHSLTAEGNGASPTGLNRNPPVFGGPLVIAPLKRYRARFRFSLGGPCPFSWGPGALQTRAVNVWACGTPDIGVSDGGGVHLHLPVTLSTLTSNCGKKKSPALSMRKDIPVIKPLQLPME